MKRDYGIDLDEYNRMFAEQHGLCKGCLKHQTQFKIRLSVDHDHKTSKVRGLLCNSCNIILGKTEDNVVILRRLADYLEQN